MIGQAIGHYRIEESLGAGGMGVVYRATDTRLGRTVAIKVIRDSGLQGAARSRLVREARVASALNHPLICTIYEVAETDDSSYIVMEHVEGRTLSAAIPPDGLPADVVVRYGVQLADALAHAHERGVVHRDLKSSNVMVTHEGRIKVLDFGLASLVREVKRTADTRSEDSFDGSRMGGTLPYMSPEALRGRAPGSGDDVWALGVLLYEMATGTLPFSGRTEFELASAIQRDAPAAIPAGVPAGLRAIILRCLTRESAARYRSSREVLAALEAVQRNAETTPPLALAPLVTRRRVTLALLVLLLIVGPFAVSNLRLGRHPPAESVAVLPFVNAEGDPEMEYLADGVTEGIIARLAQLPQERVKVIAHNTVLRYKGRDVDVQAVGKELRVRRIVLGRVAVKGDTLTINAELVSAEDRSRIWGDKFETSLRDILLVQPRLATQITTGLGLRLTAEEQQRINKQPTQNAEAHHLYLKGRYHWYRSTPEDYEKSLRYFQEAIRRDPFYALAYAGLAGSYGSMGYEGLIPPNEAYPKLEAAALKALQIDDTVIFAHSALANLAFARDWDWAAAERYYRRALDLNPHDVATHRFYGQMLRAIGRFDEAISEMRQALDLEPDSVETSKALGATYFWSRQYDRAIEQFRETLELEPNHAPTHDLLADVYAAKKMYREAAAERRSYFSLEGVVEVADMFNGDGSAGAYLGAMRRVHELYLASIEHSMSERYISPMHFVMTYAALNDPEQAFTWLEKAFAQRDPWLTSLKYDPAFDPIRPDPRFAAFVRRVGFPEPAVKSGS